MAHVSYFDKSYEMKIASLEIVDFKPLQNQLTQLPVQIFLRPPVVLPSFISRFALVLYLIDSNTTGSQKKNWSSHALDNS